MNAPDHRPPSRLRGLAAWWGLGTALWLVSAATLARPDVIAAVAAGGLVAGSVGVARRVGLVDFHFRLRWLRHLPRLAVQVMRDLIVLARVLVRPGRHEGVFRSLPYDTGGDGPERVGRRALLTLAASLGPNTFVLGFDDALGSVLVHQLVANEQVLPVPDGRFPPP